MAAVHHRPPLSRSASAQHTATSPQAQNIIDLNIFEQIRELDDEDSHEFSHATVMEYISQVGETFSKMDKADARKDLEDLHALGHFLKGSSAALGIRKVQASCEQMQHAGHNLDVVHERKLNDKDALEMCGKILARVKGEHAEAERWFNNYFAQLSA